MRKNESMHWVDVNDRLPEFVSMQEASVLLVYIPANKIPVSLAYYNEQKGFQCYPNGGVVTQWMGIVLPIQKDVICFEEE